MSDPLATTELVLLRRSPHITRPIDNTALTADVQCHWKYYASMVLHRSREGTPPPPIAAGSAWHAMMEAHYKTGGDRDAVIQALIMSWVPHDRPDDHRTMQRLELAYTHYLAHWGDHDTDCRNNGHTVGYVKGGGGSPLIECPVEISWPGAHHPYVGRIDRIYENNGLYYIEDHKTTSQMGSNYFNQFDPSPQLMGYVWLAQKLTGLKIAGARVSCTAFLKTQTKFGRKVFSYSQEKLEEWARNYNRLIDDLAERYRREAEATELEGLGLARENPDYELDHSHIWTRSWQCAERFGRMCKYASICTTSPSRRMQALYDDFDVKEWDPMSMIGDVEIVDD